MYLKPRLLLQIKKEVPESMTEKDAMMFPLIASGALFTFYIVFRVKYLNIYEIYQKCI